MSETHQEGNCEYGQRDPEHIHLPRLQRFFRGLIKEVLYDGVVNPLREALPSLLQSGEFQLSLEVNGAQQSFTVRARTSDIRIIEGILLNCPYTLPEAGDIVVDIGGNIGAFARLAALRGASAVLSFEPSSENFELLKRNTDRNPEIRCYQRAVHDTSGERELSLPRFNKGMPSLFRNTQRHETVRCITLEEVFGLGGIDHIDLLKIDAEGAEFPILLNARDQDLERIRKISLEFHDIHTCCTHEDLRRRLEKCGFTVEIRKSRIHRFNSQGILHAQKA